MRKLIYVILFFGILFCFVACNKKNSPQFDEELLLSLSRKVEPSPHSGLTFFCKSENGKILEMEVGWLEYIHEKDFSSMNYKHFLEEALNQRLELSSKYAISSFYINESVAEEYKKRKLKDFIKLYCREVEDGHYILDKNISENEKETVLYFSFINGYLVFYNDYSGFYSIRKAALYKKYV